MQGHSVFYIILVVFTLLSTSSAINCFYCNSANNSACLDVNALDPELRSRVIPVVNCETAIPSPVAVNFFCRKIVQTIFLTQRNHEVRVTRGCGWVKHHKECYRADNSDHLETVCQCFEDHCNNGHAVRSAGVLVAAAYASFFIFN